MVVIPSNRHPTVGGLKFAMNWITISLERAVVGGFQGFVSCGTRWSITPSNCPSGSLGSLAPHEIFAHTVL